MSSSLRQRIFRLLIIACFTVLLTLLAIELLVRAIPLYPDRYIVYDAVLGWHYEPQKTLTYLNVYCLGEFSNMVSFNRQGFHDTEPDLTHDKTRVLLLGDSILAALEVPLTQNFTHQTETLLAGEYELINTGVTGYNTIQELLLYQQIAPQYQAPFVILFFEPRNDWYDNHPQRFDENQRYYPSFEIQANRIQPFPPQELPANGMPVAPVNPLHDMLLSSSYLYRLLTERYNARNMTLQFNAQVPDEQRLAENWAATEAAIAHLQVAVTAEGAQLGIVLNPSLQTDPTTLAMRAEFLALFAEYQIPYLDLQDVFHPTIPLTELLQYRCDWHFTAAGHVATAPRLAEFIRQLAAQE